MGLRELAQNLTQAMEEGDFEAARNYMADDFTFVSDAFPEPMSLEEWQMSSRALEEAFPDLSYNFRIEEVEEDTVRVSSRLTGTHENDLDLSFMGMGVIPATNREVETARQPSTGYVQDGLFQRIELEQVEGGGFLGILEQLGVDPQSA